MSLVVEPLRRRRDRNEFILFPYRVYDGDPLWVPPLILDLKERLDPRRHPFFAHGEVRCFLARRNGRTVGRAAVLIDRAHNRYHSEKMVGFGLMEFERDAEVARALLREAAAFGASRGMEVLRGPLSYSTNEECGTLVEGFDRSPAVMMPYNPPWYGAILQTLGLEKGKDLVAYYIDDTTPFDRLKRLAGRALSRHDLSVRPVNLKRFEEELEIIRTLYNEAWKDNWGFVPMDRAEFRWHARKLKQVIVPGLSLIVEARGKPAGFTLCIPDVNQAIKHMKGRLFPFGLFKFLYHRRGISGLRVVAMGIRPDCRSMGAEGVLIHQTIETGMRMGYRWAELSWVLEDNGAMRKLAENMGARVYKRYRIFEAPVERLVS